MCVQYPHPRKWRQKVNKKSSWYMKYTILTVGAPFFLLGALWLLARTGFEVGYETLEEYMETHDP